MKKIFKICIMAIALNFGSVHCLFAQANSFKPGAEWMDNNGVAINAHGGGVLYHEGTYYWYGEHKIEGTAGNVAMVGVHCYSSKDLYNWQDRGVVLKVSDDPKSDIVKGSVIERPKVIYNAKTKKFVMWFHLELKDQGYLAARSAVAVCDTPTGDFNYLGSVNPNAGEWPLNFDENKRVVPKDAESRMLIKRSGDRLYLIEQNLVARDFELGQMARDMNLFVDEDGTAYHIFASEENSTTHIAKLSDDYLSHSGEYIQAFESRWMEASAVCRREKDGLYYFLASGCSGWAPNVARSGVSKSMLGQWLEHDNPCVGLNPQNGLDGTKTFGAQSTYIVKVEGLEDAYIAMFDIWNPQNAIDGRYVWLPMTFNNKRKSYEVIWHDEWDLSIFEKK